MNGEGDRVLGEVRHFPKPVRPIVGTAVEGVVSVIGFSVVRLVADSVLSVADAVNVAAGDGIVDGVGWVIR